MATYLLQLGGITFDAYSTPDILPNGGRREMNLWKLPGGTRVIDPTGPDNMDIRLGGHQRGRHRFFLSEMQNAIDV